MLIVSGPLLLTRSGFAYDFTNSLWMVWVAGKMLLQAGHPEFFLDAKTLGVFYPLFAFYGGPLYMATGALSALLGGHAEIAFVAVTMLGIAGVYGASSGSGASSACAARSLTPPRWWWSRAPTT